MGSPLGRYARGVPDSLVTVVLLDAPLHIWQRAAEHHDELMREMALLALAPDPPLLPRRLTEQPAADLTTPATRRWQRGSTGST